MLLLRTLGTTLVLGNRFKPVENECQATKLCRAEIMTITMTVHQEGAGGASHRWVASFDELGT